MLLRDRRWAVWIALTVCWVAALVLAVAPIAAAHGASLWGPGLSRLGAVVATWLAVQLLTYRIGGPLPLVAGLSAVCGVLVVVAPRGWVLSAAAVVAAATYGLLGVTMTRATAGLSAMREALAPVVFGVAGAVCVMGYDVVLRPYRFRTLVLGLALAAALAIGWRFGLGLRGLGRNGRWAVVVAVLLLVAAAAYFQAVRSWGSPGVVASLTGAKGTLHDWLGATPRLAEALVGFPAVVCGAAVRSSRHQGWWVSAFGVLAGTGIATSLLQPSVSLGEAAAATAYGLVVGLLIALLILALRRMLTGTGRRGHVLGAVDPARPEPRRAARLG